MKYTDLGLSVLWENNMQENGSRLPSKEQIKELLDECDWKPCCINNTDGYKIISKINNDFIFIPFPKITTKSNNVLIGRWQRGIFPETKQVLRRLIENMVKVTGGTFTMGATPEQGSDAYDDENPAHKVTLSDYYIGKYEVTQEEWRSVMGNNPSNFKGANNPVETVSWNDCQEFIKKLNELTGMQFRLPTEAEWEYAARGGNKSRGYKYSGSNTIGEVAWYDGDSSKATHQVGTKQANELGLYDMSGNVWEWCSDWYSYYSSSPSTNPIGSYTGPYRVCRGGSWFSNAQYCRVSNRFNYYPGYRYYNIGMRLAL